MPNLCLGLVFIGLITTSDRSGAGEVYSTVQYTGKYVPKSGSPYALCNIDSNKKTGLVGTGLMPFYVIHSILNYFTLNLQ
jgi:hypothetical protein